VETVRWPYHLDALLSYLDNGELPYILVDLLEESNPDLFYSGCVIAEVRDFRQSNSHSSYNTHHILLQPTNQVRRNGTVSTEICCPSCDFS